MRRRLPAAWAGLLCLAAPAAAQTLNTNATATEMAQAMEIPAAQIVSAQLRLPGGATPDSRGAAVVTGDLGNFFPRVGTTFTMLSSGNVADVPGGNDATGTSTDLGAFDGGMDGGGDEFVQLTVVLDPPDTARSFRVQFAFYSEEFPEFVGSAFNDFFSLEVGSSNITFNGSTPVIPNNIVTDLEGDLVSVNNDFFVQDVNQVTGTEMDGATELLEVCAPIADNTQNLTLVFTIADLGDAILDSVIMIDNFRFDDDVVGDPQTAEILVGTLLGGQEAVLEVISFPNPYRVGIDDPITFSVPGGGCFSAVRLTDVQIFTLDGRRVRQITPSTSDCLCSWDGRNDAGRAVASGVYRYLARSNDDRSAVGTITLVK